MYTYRNANAFVAIVELVLKYFIAGIHWSSPTIRIKTDRDIERHGKQKRKRNGKSGACENAGFGFQQVAI